MAHSMSNITTREKVLVSVSIQVGAWLKRYDHIGLLETKEGVVFATKKLLEIVSLEAGHNLTAEDIALFILNEWRDQYNNDIKT